MSRLAFCMVVDLLHEAARMQDKTAATLAICFIYTSQLYDNLCMSAELLQALARAKGYDLAHTYRIGMPHHPVPPRSHRLQRRHVAAGYRGGQGGSGRAGEDGDPLTIAVV